MGKGEEIEGEDGRNLHQRSIRVPRANSVLGARLFFDRVRSLTEREYESQQKSTSGLMQPPRSRDHNKSASASARAPRRRIVITIDSSNAAAGVDSETRLKFKQRLTSDRVSKYDPQIPRNKFFVTRIT